MIDNIMGTIVNKSGTYSVSVDGNLVVNTDDVVLKDITIAGNLYLTQGIGDGNVTLEGVTVKGETYVNGGGEERVIIKNSSLEGTMVVLKVDGKVRIVAMGSSEIANLKLDSGVKLQEQELTGTGFGNIEIIEVIPEGHEIVLEGDYEEITVDAPGVNVVVTDGTVNNLQITEKAEGSSVEVASQATVNTINVKAAATVTGGGTIQNASIEANGVVMEKKPENMLFRRHYCSCWRRNTY